MATARSTTAVCTRALQEPLPVWVAVGGSPESAFRAGALGLPMALAIIGGLSERFVPFTQLHRRAGAEAGHGRLELGINSHGYVAETSQAALDESFPYAAAMMDRIGRERGWPAHTRADYDAAATLRGANFVGSPQQVVEKILYQHSLFDHDRFLVQFSVGTMPHAQIMRSIELFGTEVAPAVRRELARSPPEDPTAFGRRRNRRYGLGSRARKAIVAPSADLASRRSTRGWRSSSSLTARRTAGAAAVDDAHLRETGERGVVDERGTDSRASCARATKVELVGHVAAGAHNDMHAASARLPVGAVGVHVRP